MQWKLKWNDWVLYVIRTIGFISVLYFAQKYADTGIVPVSVIMFVILLSYAVPLVLLQIGIKPYLIAELALLALLVPYLSTIDKLLAGNIVIYAMMVGFYNERRWYMGSGICIAFIAFAGPVYLLANTPVSYISVVLSCLLYAVLGFVFHFLVAAREEMESKNRLIKEQYRLLEQYSKQVGQNARLRERDRISNELQDSISHTFASLALGLESLKTIIAARSEEDLLSQIMKVTESGLTDVKQAVQAMQPLELNVSLNEMIQLAVDDLNQDGLEILLRLNGEEREASKEHKLLLIQCLHESVSLARREGNAQHIRITLQYAPAHFELRVEDDGHTNEEQRYTNEFAWLKGQLTAAGGTLHMETFLDRGMTVVGILPLLINTEPLIKIIVTDSEPLVLEAISTLLSLQKDMAVLRDSSNGADLLEVCVHEHADIILLSTNHLQLDYIALIRSLKESSPALRIILMTSSDNDRELAMEAIHLGAEGFIEKAVSSRELLSKIRLVHRGEMIITQQLAKQLVQSIKDSAMPNSPKSNEYGLTEREMDVLQCLSRNMKYKEIAEHLFLAEGTVRNYLSMIYSKLEVTSRTQAAEKAQREGIV